MTSKRMVTTIHLSGEKKKKKVRMNLMKNSKNVDVT